MRGNTMHVRRVIWFGVSALAVASWFAGASTSGLRPAIVPLAPPRPAPLDRSMAVLQSEVARLHERLAPTAIPTRSRDLFRFSTRAPRRPLPAAPAPVAAEASAPAAAPAAPVLKLIGIAEDSLPEGVVRTAIVSGLGDVFLVRPGDMVGGRYRVEQVSGSAVQLTDVTTAAGSTLALR
jgi:hypothetical protein